MSYGVINVKIILKVIPVARGLNKFDAVPNRVGWNAGGCNGGKTGALKTGAKLNSFFLPLLCSGPAQSFKALSGFCPRCKRNLYGIFRIFGYNYMEKYYYVTVWKLANCFYVIAELFYQRNCNFNGYAICNFGGARWKRVGGVGYNGIVVGFGAVGNRSVAYGAASAASSRAGSALARGHTSGSEPGAKSN
ncbi:hypothetical protein GGTG_00989 [Gaeumannomyces tritici R3-111a-1]|uniref:Uncharacterized protein n=1 Tax=Gaeumannomyces tritici (strain R3-111a-1) TaxID=644352 RepID=J3NIA6_GAET3|nr:hypothetical protein GGTG_00989 [Gaeumannomyces tritici R3-111a-1]EJT80999.1 hypothetical protein GGTG_00989 [Gaeumannomyces tritici R3-111a-1]